MSDSLLNLLEVLNEVLEEQGLQEQASGGAPTEDQLWGIVSPGLVNYIKNLKTGIHVNKRPRAERVTLLLEELKNKNFNVAFGILNYKLSGTTKNRIPEDPNNQKIIGLADWLIKLNNFYLQNPDSGTVVKPEIINAILNGYSLGTGNFGKPTTNLGVRKNLIPFLKEEFGIRITKDTNEYRLFMENLSEGRGIVSTRQAFKGARDNPAVLAPELYFLDPMDYGELKKQIKNGEFSTVQRFFKAVSNKSITDAIKNKHIEMTKQTIASAMDELLSDTAKIIKFSKNIKDFFVKSQESENRRAYPEFQPFIQQLENKFLQNYKDFLKKAGSGDTLTSPRVSAEKLKFSNDFDVVIDNFFGKELNNSASTEGVISQKINLLTDKMKIFASENLESELSGIETRDFVNRVLLMEYFIEMSKGFESRTAGKLFEYFLAKLIGGTVTGQRGDAVDFEIEGADGKELGSAKLLSTEYSGTLRDHPRAVQAVSSFSGAAGEKIVYIIGVKITSPIKVKRGAAEPLEIEKVDIYKFNVTYGKDGKIYVDESHREDLFIKKGKEGTLQIDFGRAIKEMTPKGTLQIMTTTEEGIKGFRQRAQAAVTGDTKKILNLVEKLFKNLRLADEKSRIYTSSGKVSDGTGALNALTDSQTNLREIGDYAFKDKPDEYDKLPDPNDA